MNTALIDTAFFRHTTNLNIARAKLCAIIAIIIEVFLLSRNFFKYGFSLHYYVLLYVFLLTISIVLYGALVFIEKNKDDINYQLANRIIFIYHFFTLLWGVTMALLDQNSYGHVTAYLINLLITATLFITSRKMFVTLHIIPLATLIAGFYIFFPNSPFNNGHIVNISIFFVFVYIGTKFIFDYTKKTFEQEQALNAQNEELNRLNLHLEQLANTDALTTLYNRHYLTNFIEQMQKDHKKISLWIIDIDHFKAYNDHYGHLLGDDTLKQIAKELQQLAKVHQLLPVRLGGEEFLLVGFNYPIDQTAAIAENIRQSIENLRIEHVTSPTNSVVTASIGYIADDFTSTEHFTELLNTADQALYVSKQSGRNRIVTI